ncbi:hypothetical protein IWQ61_004658 [Dispira simplex]|nr:hypothetical protein IWQ61_004658 [Dispira simplex]
MKAFIVTALVSLLAMAPCSDALVGSYSPQALCCHTNYYRAKYGGSSFSHPYYFSPSISAVTQQQAEDMSTQKAMVHKGLGAGNENSFKRITNVKTIGMEIERTGENIADKYNNMKDVMLAWWESEDHRDHMDYTQEYVVCGSGHAYNQEIDRDYWAQDFAVLKGDMSNRDLQVLDCSGIFAEYGLKVTPSTETQKTQVPSTTPTDSVTPTATPTASGSTPPTATPTDDGSNANPSSPDQRDLVIPSTKPPGKCKKCRKCKKRALRRR